MNKFNQFLLLIGVLVIVLALGAWSLPYLRNISVWNISSPQGQINTQVEQSTQANNPSVFVPLEKPIAPPFMENIKTATDIEVGYHYNGDYTQTGGDWGFTQDQYYTDPVTSEKYLIISKTKDRQNFEYGSSEYLPIFKSQESHSYQGSPIYITNPKAEYALSYLGFKISDRSLMSELTVSLGIDYNAEYWQGSAKNNNKFSVASLLGIPTATACGPGLFLRKVGDAKLIFVVESDGVAWYKLDNPINMYNLSLQYADQDCTKMPAYCNNLADNPQECDKYFSCYYNATISGLDKGNLRIHVNYKPNDKEGLLKIQMANFIVSDKSGTLYQAEAGEYFNHYYKATLK